MGKAKITINIDVIEKIFRQLAAKKNDSKETITIECDIKFPNMFKAVGADQSPNLFDEHPLRGCPR